FVALRDIAGRVGGGAASAAADMERWRQRLDRPQRPADDPEQRTRERTTYDSLRKTLPEAIDHLKKAVALLDQHQKAVAEGNRKESWEAVTQDAKNVLTVLDAVIAVQTQARIHLIELPEVEWTEQQGLAYAHENRLDLQNRLGVAT